MMNKETGMRVKSVRTGDETGGEDACGDGDLSALADVAVQRVWWRDERHFISRRVDGEKVGFIVVNVVVRTSEDATL